MQYIPKPKEGEYAPYAIRYINMLPDDGHVLQQMEDSLETMKQLVLSLSEEQLLYRYEPGKWTIKQVLQHIMDAERVFTYRALSIARADTIPLPGFSENDYAIQASNANERSIGNLMHEYEALRHSSLALFNSFTEEMLTRTGTANNTAISVRALPYYCAGHEMHHTQIIRERYLQ